MFVSVSWLLSQLTETNIFLICHFYSPGMQKFTAAHRTDGKIMAKFSCAVGVLIMVFLILAAGWYGVPLAIVFGLPWVLISRRIANGRNTGGYIPMRTTTLPCSHKQSFTNDHVLNPAYSFMSQNIYHNRRY